MGYLSLKLFFVEEASMYLKMNILCGTRMLTFFQENPWINTNVVVDWLEKTLKPATAKLDRFILLVDNLTAQIQGKFKEAVSNNNGIVWYGLPNVTYI